MRLTTWWRALAALVAVRLAIPLVALAASGRDLPALPRYTYAPLNGDAFGYHAAARETISATGRLSPVLLLVVVLAVVAAAIYLRRTWATPRRWLGLLAVGAAGALPAALVVNELEPPGAPVVGWPLLWAVPLAPYRLLAEPSVDAAFAAAFVLSLLSIAATVVATAYLGLYASARRWVGVAAAALYTAWPFVARAAAGESAWENGQWHVDVGLHLYTEPISTALVAVGLALILKPAASPALSVVAGYLLGLATAVKLSNAVIAVILVAAVAARAGPRHAGLFAAAGACWIPVVALYWPKGYEDLYEGKTAPGEHAWAPGNTVDAWTESLVFTPLLTLVLVVLATVGAFALRRDLALTLAAPILATAALYSVYSFTPQHPRFFYVVLPPLFVLVASAPLATGLRGRDHAVRA